VRERRRYVKRAGQAVAAVQLRLDTSGFHYEKWGGTQTCKPGDWIVDNEGDVYTIDRVTFERTYRQVSRGLYSKTTAVWAEVAAEAGHVTTKEGVTHYQAGDYLVSNDDDGGDAYAISAKAFTAMYEPASVD
jgi:hypothetical protein